MKCSDKEWRHCQKEKRGCEGCFYNDEISIGEYVRTDKGIITKAQEHFIDGLLNGKSIFGKAVKHSKNIIDLIQEGDYVNGVRILDITGDYIHTAEWDCCRERLRKKLKSIITKEQIKQIEFRIKE